jgi:hypothetical protein
MPLNTNIPVKERKYKFYNHNTYQKESDILIKRLQEYYFVHKGCFLDSLDFKDYEKYYTTLSKSQQTDIQNYM